MERVLTVSEMVGACSSALELSFERVVVEGEVASYKVNQGKYIFFDLKDSASSLPCFMMLFALRMPVVDGMRVRVIGTPKITAWGKFSFTVQQVMPVGEGSIKKSLEMLKKKLEGEGLFAPERKRPLPEKITRIGVVSSLQAAGYADFVKILDERWGGLKLVVAHSQVQGMGAAEQMIGSLRKLNERGDLDVIAVIRGGGSADDLAVFNDEMLAREIAVSKTPVITGIGHEVDESMADLVADVRASTPSNAAQILTPDKNAEKARAVESVERVGDLVHRKCDETQNSVVILTTKTKDVLTSKVDNAKIEVEKIYKILEQLNPERVLERGYSIVRGDLTEESVVGITTVSQVAEAVVQNVKDRKS